MAISDDLNSITGHLEDDYTALEQLGVSVEDRNIENIKDMANQIYAKFPKTSYAEGSNITLSNTLKGKLDFEDGIVGYGDTKQEIDLTENNLTSQSANGLTITVNTDKSITINGTASADTKINILNNTIGSTPATERTVEAGTYQLTGCPSGSSSGTKFTLQVLRSGYIMLEDTGSGAVNTITNSQTYTFIRIIIFSGTQCNNLVFRPKLLKIPSPFYPQDIEVVRGKNRLDVTQIRTPATNVGIAINSNGAVYDETPTGDNRSSSYANSNWQLKLPKGNWTISFNFSTQATNSNSVCHIYNSSGTLLLNGSLANKSTYTGTINLSEDTDIGIFSKIYDGVAFIQLEEGTQATSYLPYNTLEVVERGKNLWYSSEYNNTYADLNIKFTNNKVILNGTNSSAVDLRVVDVSNNWNTNSQSILNYINNKNGNYCASNNSGFDTYFYMSSGSYSANTTQVTDSVKVNSIFIRIPINSTFTNKDIEFQLQEGSATDYEPYQTPQTYQLSLGEYEFAKIGNYVDTIEYDVDEDKVYKNENIGKYTFTGNENMAYDSGSVRFVINDLVNNLEVSGRQQIYSNRYKFIASGSADYGMFAYYNTVHQIFIYNKDYTNPSDLLSYFANNNTYFYYIRNNLNKIEITGTLKDQIKALYYSQSFTGTTIIEINGQLPLIIKVRALKGE